MEEVSSLADGRHRPVISLNAIRWDRTYRRLWSALETFCESHLDDDFMAEGLFFGYPPEAELLDQLHSPFLDWAAFDYRDWEGTTCLERFRNEGGPWDAHEDAMLDAWKKSRISLYRVLGQTDTEVRLQSCLTDAEVVVRREEDVQPFETGDLVVCRLLEVGDSFRFGFHVESYQPSAEPRIRRALDWELTRIRRANPAAGWDDLLAERWPVLREEILQAALLHVEPPRVLPDTPPSLGLTEAPADATALHLKVASLLAEFLEAEDFRHSERLAATRMWWDAVVRVAPRTGKAEGWAAGVTYAFARYVLMDEMTQADVADFFGVSTSTVKSRSREIEDALQLGELDDRYADALDARVRFAAPVFSRAARTAVAALPAEEAVDEATHVVPLMLEGQTLLHQGQPAAAREKFTAALALVPDAVPIRNTIAMTYVVEGNHRVAIETALPVLDVDPDCVQTLALLAICYSLSGDAGQARRYAATAASSYRNERKFHKNYDPEEHASDLHMTLEALILTESDEVLLHTLRDEPVANVRVEAMEHAATAAKRLGRSKEASYWRNLAKKHSR
jgi:tetratricopeptide (TPR) repeat protein